MKAPMVQFGWLGSWMVWFMGGSGSCDGSSWSGLVPGMVQLCVVWFMTSVVMRIVISILLLTESPQQIRGMPGWGIGCQGIIVVVLIALSWSIGEAMSRCEPPVSLTRRLTCFVVAVPPATLVFF